MLPFTVAILSKSSRGHAFTKQCVASLSRRSAIPFFSRTFPRFALPPPFCSLTGLLFSVSVPGVSFPKQSMSNQRLFFTNHSYSSTLRNNAIPLRWISPHIHFTTSHRHCLTSPSNTVTTHFFAATWLCYAAASLFYAIPCQCSTIQSLNYALPYQGRTFLLLLLSVPLRKFASPLLSFSLLFCTFPAPIRS